MNSKIELAGAQQPQEKKNRTGNGTKQILVRIFSPDFSSEKRKKTVKFM